MSRSMSWSKFAAATALALLAAACADAPQQPAPAEAAPPPAPTPAPVLPQGEAQQLSYAVGYDLGVSLRQVSAYVRSKSMNQGMDDAWHDRAPSLSEADQARAKGELTALARGNSLADNPQAAGEDLPGRFSYALGTDVGRSTRGDREHFDESMLQAAIDDGLRNQPPRMDEGARKAVRERVRAQVTQARADRAAQSQAKSQAFLAANAHRVGVKQTASGLQYEVLVKGRGKHPAPSQMVTVNYTGTLIDGTVFDDSRARGAPVSFPLNQVIPGWTEGVALMRPGARYKFYIPAALAYGERGAGDRIGPNQALVFDVELLKIE